MAVLLKFLFVRKEGDRPEILGKVDTRGPPPASAFYLVLDDLFSLLGLVQHLLLLYLHFLFKTDSMSSDLILSFPPIVFITYIF